MRAQFSRGSVRRRFLALAGLALLVALMGVQAAGGASTGRRVVSATRHVAGAAADPSSLTPSNQPTLDAAADDARALVPSSFFAGVVVDDIANVVNLYMAHAPQSVIDQLQAKHPGLYVIHNAAPNARSAVLARLSSLDVQALATRGVAVVSWGPTEDGRLQIGVSSDLSTAQTVLAQLFGNQSVSVFPTTSPIYKTTYRYNDVSPWNGGDFVYHNGGGNPSCTSGVPVHGSGTYYLITAAHCWDGIGGGDGLYTTVYNGYFQDNGVVYPGSSQTLIGKVMHIDDNANGATTLDSGLIQASSSVDDFDAAWNSAGKAVEIGEIHNNVGDQVCTSGAWDGQACSIVISAMDQSIYTANNRGGHYTTNHLAVAANPNNSNAVATGFGDSGGPVYSYNGSNVQVRGMVDAGQTTVTCTSNPTGTSRSFCLHTVYFVEQYCLDQEWGVTPNS